MSTRAITRVVVVLALLASALVLAPNARAAATITVTTTDDELNSDTDCSLREAIRAANTNAAVDQCGVGATFGDDQIIIQDGQTYTLDVGPAGDDAALTGDLDITGNTRIVGGFPGNTIVEVDRTAFNDRVFDIIGGPTVEMAGFTIRYGNSPGFGNHGGGIRSASTSPAADLSLDFMRISENDSGGVGAGIYSAGSLTITNSNVMLNDTTGNGAAGIHVAAVTATLDVTQVGFQQNTSSGLGGAITNYGTTSIDDAYINSNQAATGGGIYNGGAGGTPSLTVTDTRLFFNSAGTAGAIFNSTGGVVIIDRSSFEFNNADRAGTIINDAILTLTNSTITGSSADIQWGTLVNSTNLSDTTLDRSTISDNTGGNTGGVYLDRGTLTLRDSILANSSTGGATPNNVDCVENDSTGNIVLEGSNILEDPGDCPVGGAGAAMFVDPQLQSADFYGGPSRTMPPSLNSPALDAGTLGDCPAIDQRGFSRPADGPDADSTAECDIGAVESRTVSVGDATVREADGSTTRTLSFPLTLSASVPGSVDVTVSVTPLTASETDYSCSPPCTAPSSATVTFDPNDPTTVFEVQVTPDNLNEGSETLKVELLNATLATLIDDDDGIGTINDDDVEKHARTVELNLRRHLKAKGRVEAATFEPCHKRTSILIQRRSAGKWKTIESLTTRRTGSYVKGLADKQGSYRAIAPRDKIVNGGVHVCKKAISNIERHRHR